MAALREALADGSPGCRSAIRAYAKGVENPSRCWGGEQGYWPLTKQLVDAILPTVAGKNLYLTGHSQGGGRAQLVSMWLEKQKGMTVPTYTFDGVGVQCAVRYALPAAYAADVDVTVLHPQITQYVHALDAYGQMDFQGGRVCKYGTGELRDRTTYSAARDFCERSVGWAGARLLVGPLFEEEEKNFAMCRYFTHWSTSVVFYLEQDAVLLADGTTDGGCANETLVPSGDPENLCPPCRTTRCAVQLPEIALNWQNQVVDAHSKALLHHPCLGDNAAPAPMLLSTVPLTGELTQGNKFQHCTFLGGAADYLLTGASGGPTEQVFNAVFRVATLAMDASFQSGFFMQDKSLGGVLKQHVVVTYTVSPVSAPVVVIDHEFAAETKQCGVVNKMVQLPKVQSDGKIEGLTAIYGDQHRDTFSSVICVFATLEGVSPASNELVLYAGLSRSGSDSQLLSVKVSTNSAANGLQAASTADLLLPGTSASAAVFARLGQIETAALDYKPLLNPDYKLIPQDHFCLSGVAVEERVAFQKPLALVKNENDSCVVLGSGSGAKLSVVNALTPSSNPPTSEASEACFERVKQRILAAGFEQLDVGLLNSMMTEMHLLNVPSLQGAIAAMRGLDITSWLDQVKACAMSNPILAEFVCEAIEDANLQPNTGSDEMLTNKHIKDAVHYSVLLDGITKAISADMASFAT
eukprot:g14261.t1